MDQLSAYQKVQLARHPQRPYFLDYIQHLCPDFVEMHGDRRFADDPAIVAGFGSLGNRPVCMLGHQKGKDTKQRQYRNFGMPKPEGYRKALRVMKIAEKFNRPILTFIDTPGAYPGIDAEERAQNDPAGMAKCLGSVLERQLRELQNASPDELVDCRHKKFRAMGAFGE